MPLLRFDLIEGRTDGELKILLDAAHEAMLAAFKVPARDRYQIVHEHKATRMVVEDTGLDIPRTDKVVMLQGHEPAARQGGKGGVLQGALRGARSEMRHQAERRDGEFRHQR